MDLPVLLAQSSGFVSTLADIVDWAWIPLLNSVVCLIIGWRFFGRLEYYNARDEAQLALRTANADAERLHKSLKSLENRTSHERVTLGKLKEEYQKGRQSLLLREKDLAERQKDIERLERESGTQRELVGVRESELKELRRINSELEPLRHEVATAAQQHASLEQELEELRERDTERGAIEEDNARLQTEIEQYELVEQESQAKATRLEAKQKSIEALQLRISELEQQVAALTSENAKRAGRISELEPLADTEQELLTARERIAELQASVENGLESHDGVSAELARARVDLEGKESALASLQQSFEQLAPLGDQVRDWQDKFEEQVRSHDEALRERDKANASLEMRVAQLEPLLPLQEELARAQVRVGEQEEQLASGAHEQEKLRRKIAELEPLTEEVADHDERLVTMMRQHQTTLEERDGEIDRLRHKVQELEPLIAISVEHNKARNRIETLESEREVLAQERAQLKTRVGELEPLGSEVKNRDEHIRKLVLDHANENKDRETEIQRLAARVAELEPLSSVERELEKARKRIEQLGTGKQLQRDLEARVHELEPLTVEVGNRDEHIRKLVLDHRKTIQTKDTRLDKLEEKTAAARQREKQLKEDLRAARKELSLRAREAGRVEPLARKLQEREQLLANFQGRIKELETRVGAAGRAQPVRAKSTARAPARKKPAPARKDELQEIFGIGPNLEKKLYRAGVRTYEEIASWKAADIEAIAERVGTAASRIKQQKWVTHARRLARQR